MEQKKIDRINELAKKHREQGLTDIEKEERLLLRNEYIEDFRKRFSNVLENTYIQYPDGKNEKIKKKKS